jgi:hypothetical protein
MEVSGGYLYNATSIFRPKISLLLFGAIWWARRLRGEGFAAEVINRALRELA